MQRTVVNPQLLCGAEGVTCRRTALYPKIFNCAVDNLRAQLHFLDCTECRLLEGDFETAEMHHRVSC